MFLSDRSKGSRVISDHHKELAQPSNCAEVYDDLLPVEVDLCS